MSFINSIDIDTKSGYRSFELHQGDITQLGFPVGGIVVSAFSGGYIPVPGTILGAFHEKGVSVKHLFENQKFDYRNPFSVWVAENSSEAIDFDYLFCLEIKGTEFTIQEAIRNLFTVLTIAELKGLEIKTLAIPLLGTGNQKIDPAKIVEDLIQLSLDFLKYSRHIEKIIYVAFDDEKATFLHSEMNRILGRNMVVIPRGDRIEKLKKGIKNEIEKIRRLDVDDESFRNILDAFRREDSTAYEFGSTSRKVLEFIIDYLIKPELNISLFKKIAILNQSKIAKWYIQYFHLVREFGNLNVHHRSDNQIPSEMELEDVELGLSALFRILAFFKKYLKNEMNLD
ncbi:hypothetical protein [Algoriphagus limi]|uniref:Macro domain-containing protein n=1 Tax=Algoriphagus limi TaxID=2975273 RepID=A0ABT2G0S5_9BACT|nr:hypothetical protein [Algoriphagus limi]MCS5488870.1 hypothetical protein [Algoriphagus limi]